MGPPNWQARPTKGEAIEKKLKQALEAARAAYKVSSQEYEKQAEIISDRGLNHVDGANGLRIAARQYNYALQNYQKVNIEISGLWDGGIDLEFYCGGGSVSDRFIVWRTLRFRPKISCRNFSTVAVQRA